MLYLQSNDVLLRITIFEIIDFFEIILSMYSGSHCHNLLEIKHLKTKTKTKTKKKKTNKKYRCH